jgi:agmatine deiminase
MLAPLVALVVASAPLPAVAPEWAPQRAVWLSWPRYDNVRDMPVAPVVGQLAAQLSKSVDVELIVSDPEMRRDAAGLIQAEEGDLGRVRFHELTNQEIWIRDFGPIFVRGANGKPAVATFRFNYWGYDKLDSKVSQNEDQVDEFAARALKLPTVASKIVSEGGNREFNGAGVMMAVWEVERQRNPGRTQAQIEAEFKRVFRVKKVIWIPQGVAEDDLTFNGPLPGKVYTVITTGGHVDNVARFIAPDTILLAEVTAAEAKADPIARISRERLLRAERIVRAATDAQGRPFKIVRMPSPDAVKRMISPGDGVYDFISALTYASGPFPVGKPVKAIAAGSYMNFLITNRQVITSTFWRPGRAKSMRRKDLRARAVLESAFPGRTIVSLDAEAVNWGGGGIHCITQQEPKF